MDYRFIGQDLDAIEAQKDFEFLDCIDHKPKEKIVEPEPENRQPSPYNGLLAMTLLCPDDFKPTSKRLVSLVGHFEPDVNEIDGYAFSVLDKTGVHFLPISGFNMALTPLLDYCIQHNTTIRLTAKSKKRGVLEVLDILQANGGKPSMHQKNIGFYETDPGQPLFRSIIWRLLTGKGDDPAPPRPSKKFTTIDQLKTLLEISKHTFPDSIVGWAEDNLQRYESPFLSANEHERGHIQRALTYLLNIDWAIRRPMRKPLDVIRAELNERLYGLEDLKMRILEIAAQLHHTNELPKHGLLLVGPAGVGKTTCAEIIGEFVLGLPSFRLDLNLIDSAEAIGGSSRLYANAKPGRFIEELYSIGIAHCVCILNELDKAGSNSQRENASSPTKALLSLLDGKGFRDEFCEHSIDTRSMFFIATANSLDDMPKPLQDRFLIINIGAYTKSEKRIIMMDYSMPTLLRDNHLTPEQLSLSEEALDLICSDYALLPGARDLEKFGERLVARYLYNLKCGGPASVRFSAEDIKIILGPGKAFHRRLHSEAGIMLSGFMYEGTPHVFPVEAVVRPGTGQFETLNIPEGALRDYCRAAYLCARQHSTTVDYNTQDVTVFVPDTFPSPAAIGNCIGAAAYAAITSAVEQSKLLITSNMAFIGGVDLYGNTFLDQKNICLLLNALGENGIETVYAPSGSGELINGTSCAEIEVIESDSISLLVEMANLRALADIAKLGTQREAEK